MCHGAWRTCFHVCWLVCLFVCQQDFKVMDEYVHEIQGEVKPLDKEQSARF